MEKKNYILVKTSPDVCILLILLWNMRVTGFGRLVVTQQENDLAAGNIRVIETPKTLQNCVTKCRDTCKNFSKSP